MVRVGEQVTARVQIAEQDMDGKEIVHALPGDKGVVIDCRPDYLPTIRWQRGTVCDCDPESDFDTDTERGSNAA